MRGIMDAVSDPNVHTVVVMSSAQVGKTEALLNIIGFHIAQDPAPMLVLMPTLEMGESLSKDRIAPMLRDTPALRNKVKDPRARDSGNTLLHKTFPGGHITIAGSNSPASLASRPCRVVLCDEVDRFPASAGTEGDPVSLARKRSTTFVGNRKAVLTSTPTIKGASRVEAEFELSDKRRYYVACEDCGHEQTLHWERVQWPDGESAKAVYVCEGCGSCWDDAARWRLLRKGKWLPTAPFSGVAGFHLNEIYSPWVKLADMARSFLAAKQSPEELKTWVNTSLGETWQEQAETVDGHELLTRVEKWDAAPQKTLVVTAGIDVQADRLECERVGWGDGEESWSLDYRVFYGSPADPETWAQLDEYLLTPTVREDGREFPVEAACVDSGGHHTQIVYRWTRDRWRRRVWAIKGANTEGKTVWPDRGSKKKAGTVFIIGVDAAKDAIFARLRIQEPGPGYCHFPAGRDPVYFEQLTSEVVQTKLQRGLTKRFWFLPKGRRNEALDCRVYAYAALQSLNIKWHRLLAAEQRQAAPPRRDVERGPEPARMVEPVVAARQAPARPRGNWIGGGRGGGWLR